jgi:membrane-associated phospholipid phosphatase
MKIIAKVCLLLVMVGARAALAQESRGDDAGPRLLDASVPSLLANSEPSLAQRPIGLPEASAEPALPTSDPKVSWRRMPQNIIRDQGRIFSFPAQLVRGKHLLPVAAVLATTAALIAADPPAGHAVRNTDAFSGFNRVFSGNNTALATLVAPLSIYAVGLVRRDSYAQQTALLAGQAVADAEILTTVLKDVDRRLRPSDVSPHGNFYDTWFEGGINGLGGNGSFPSGHTIAAFSVATVVAERYRSHRWVPYVAYGAAALVGFSRISLQSHFPSDVFVGAALGYSISRFVVLRR